MEPDRERAESADRSPPPSADRPAPPRRIPSPTHERERERDRDRVPAPSSQTTLPPIHELHPGLAHASIHPPPPPPQQPYMHGATYPIPSSSSLGVRHAPDPDSDQEATQGRQKQKRRRQALSCTECKRRKIKCDRANPCGPCVRRGEQTKCQWHIIEPMEKYVTRAEFDELKSRLQELETMFMRGAPPASSPSAPISRRLSTSAMMPMTSGPPPEPVQGTAITPYQAYGTASYPLRPPSPRSPVRGGEPPPPYHRQPPPGTARSPVYRAPPPSITSGSGVAARNVPPPPPPPMPAASSVTPRRASSPRSPPKTTPMSPNISSLRAGSSSSSAPSVRRSSISLADLTSPYNTEPRQPAPPKNYTAQTRAPPGHRLRTSQGPAPSEASPRLHINIVDIRPQVPV